MDEKLERAQGQAPELAEAAQEQASELEEDARGQAFEPAEDSQTHAPELDEDGYVRQNVWAQTFDRLYRRTDRLYYEMARDCGVPETAYWLMYAIFSQGGQMPVKDISDFYGYSKQTVNSALRNLESKGMVKTSFCEGSRKAKQVSFTELGKQLVDEKIVPANKAERRAFQVLTESEQAELLRLIDKYIEGVEKEIAIMKGQVS